MFLLSRSASTASYNQLALRWTIVAVASALTVSTVSGQSAGLTDADAETALAAAREPRYESSFVEAHGRFAAYFSVLVQGPIGRTMDLAREAFESYKPL